VLNMVNMGESGARAGCSGWKGGHVIVPTEVKELYIIETSQAETTMTQSLDLQYLYHKTSTQKGETEGYLASYEQKYNVLLL
jgi:hypothetical protein